MLNPWVILAIVIAFAVSNAGSYFYGEHTQANSDKAAQVDAIHDAIVQYDAIAEKDKDTAVKQAVARTAQNSRATTIKGKFDDTVSKAPLPVSCDWSADSFMLLVEAVNNAADHPPAQPGVSNTLPAPKPASKPQR